MKKQTAPRPGDPTVDYPYTLPYGLRPEKGVLVKDEKKAPIVTQIFTLAGEGADATRIAETLNAQGVESPVKDQEWTAGIVEAILQNPAYVGDWGGFGRIEEALVEPAVFESAQSSAAG